MNKFTKTTINTYKEKNTILASKHPKKASKLASIQFCESQIHVEIIYNFNYIQKIIMPLCQKREVDKARHLCLLANLDLHILFLFNLFFYPSPKFILTFTFSFFCFLVPYYYIIAATKSCSVTTTTKVNLIFHQKRKTICKW